jgi:hypothetical protein
MAYRHASFDADDMARHLDTYLVDRPEWALLDHDKPGLDRAATARSEEFCPVFRSAVRGDGVMQVEAAMPEVASDELGAPRRLRWHLAARNGLLSITLLLEGKPANRMPEAGFASFAPSGARDWTLLKTGLWLDPSDTARRAGRGLHAVFGARARLGNGACEIVPLDAALAGPDRVDFMRYSPAGTDEMTGLRFVLYTNKWGTNFPMWWEGDLVSRWELRADPVG